MTTVFGKTKMVAYWGQQSANDEGDLADYCADDTYDIIVIGFVYLWPTAGSSKYPGLNFADHCSTTFDKADPELLICSGIATDIEYCQQQGKQILLSFGGADGTYGFTSDTQATTFATTVWDMFLGGTSTVRPFGTAVLDGIDLDIESGATTGYVAFIAALRTLFATDSSKSYYISSAPQCVYPDEWLGPAGSNSALESSWFDYVWVQFYNNYCGLNAYGTQFNFNTWANWASTISVNPNVQVFIGAPASSSAAGTGYVSSTVLKTIATAVAAEYPSIFGGIMLWDAGTAADNNDFGGVLGSFLHSSSSTSTSTSTTGKTSTSTTGTKTSTSTTGTTSTSTTGTKTSTSTTGSKTSTSTTGSKHHTSSTSTSTTGKASTSTTGAATASTTGKASSASTTGSDSCTLGDQQCSGTASYKTCSYKSRAGDTYWAAAQGCPTGLSCHASSTGNNVYCY